LDTTKHANGKLDWGYIVKSIWPVISFLMSLSPNFLTCEVEMIILCSFALRVRVVTMTMMIIGAQSDCCYFCYYYDYYHSATESAGICSPHFVVLSQLKCWGAGYYNMPVLTDASDAVC
jgi:hypothetical protein